MSSYFDDEPEAGLDERLENFLRICMAQIVDLADSKRFLDWISMYGEYLLPEVTAQINPEVRTPAQVFRALGREIWSATPLPHKKFMRERLPTPTPNDFCHCGSGRRFRQCCGQWDNAELGLKSMELLPHLLDVLPKKRWVELADSPVSEDSIAAAAFGLLEQGAADDVVKLLTPWFAREDLWPDQLSDLFDLLLSAYELLDKRKKRKDLAMTATMRGEPKVAAVGWQRLAAMLTDEGKLPQAWTAFNHAQRADPDSVSLATLEITILLSQKNWEQASHRARFWAARIARMHGSEMAELLEYLNQVAHDPQASMQQINTQMMPAFGQLSTLLAAAPDVTCCYRLQMLDEPAEHGQTALLEPDPALVRAQAAWKQAFPPMPPVSVQMTSYNAEAWNDADIWLSVLASYPILWQDFGVLDDLVCAVDGLNTFGLEPMLQTLTNRALSLLECVLTAQHTGAARLDWSFLQNRAALRLVVRYILERQNTPDNAAALPWLKRMVDQFNPNDNHGLRYLLMRHYLKNGEFSCAMELGKRYPDDIGPMRYNCALACYRAGNQTEADDVLTEALHEYPLIGKTLLAKRAAKPKDGSITIGSKDEANRYRAEHLPLWTDDALQWLAAARKR